MGALTMFRRGWMGLTLGICLGTAVAQNPGAVPKAEESAAKAVSAPPAVKKLKKTALTNEQKQFEQSIQAMRVESDKLNTKSVQDARNLEKERLAKEKTGKTRVVLPTDGTKKEKDKAK